MSILQKLTLRHLRLNRRRTVLTIIGILLSVAMVTAVSGFVVSFQDLLYRESVALEGLWHVRYSGLSPQQAQAILEEPVFAEGELLPTEEGVQLSLLFTRLHKGIFDESEAVCMRHGVGQDQVRYHNNLLIARGIVPGPYYGALYSFAGILLGLVAVGSVLVISNAFAISADQRSLQFGLLKSAGATRQQIRGMVLFEGLALAAVAIPLGILAGFLAQWVALSIANRLLGSMSTVNLGALFRVVLSPAALGVTVLAALLTVFLAAWRPARRASRTSPVDAIRQTGAIKLSPRSVRVSPLTRLLFGFEGVLAAKSLGRSRGKYRATILALVVSIVLFIGVSSFADILQKATSMIYTDLGANVLVGMNGEDLALHRQLAEEMAGWEGLPGVYPSRSAGAAFRPSPELLTREYRDYFGEEALPDLSLYSIGDRDFDKLCARLGLSPEKLAAGDGISAIVVNDSGTLIRQGRRINFVPFRLAAGDRLPISLGEEERTLVVAGVVREIPVNLQARLRAQSLNVIVSDRDLDTFFGPGQRDHYWLTVLAEDAAGFAESARLLLEEAMPEPHSWYVQDFEQIAAANRNISTLVMIFVYGFIAMLSLIGVTSVIATISTGITLRTREFAMLRSVGMTEASISKMLRYESLLYGLRALLWGIPLGLAACRLLYAAMTSVMDFPFLWPVRSVVISVVAILAITFTTMSIARRKQRQVNIVGALRADVI